MTTYVIVDLETTGLDARRNSILEFAGLVLEDGEVIDEFETLLRPQDKISAEITEITGITPEMVEDAPSLFAVRARIRRLLSDYPLVGHNVGFDAGFLHQDNIGLTNPPIDTLTLATILLPGLPRYNLEFLAIHLNLPLPEGGQDHRAMSDALLTAELLMILRERALQLDMAVLSEIVEAGTRVSWPEAIFFEEALKLKAKTAFSGNGGRAPRRGKRLNELFKPGVPDGRPPVEQEDIELIPGELIFDMFGPEGNFSRTFPNFEYRDQQIDMVAALVDAFNTGRHLMVEAGTGTGKSVGYLLPAAFWAVQNGRRVVVSTNTINLQDQLVEKDIPALKQVLPFEFRTAIRKGRSNYVCTRLFQQLRHRGVTGVSEMPLYARLLVWLPQTDSGDVAEISLRSFDERMMWSRLSADNDVCKQDNCVENRCPRYIAQKRAEHAHIVIVNHALLLSDLANENHILPPFKDLIIDEAHHLEPAVTDGLSFEADRRFLERVVEDIIRGRGGLLTELTGKTNIIPPGQRAALDKAVEAIRRNAELARTRIEEFFTTLSFFLSDRQNGNQRFAEQIRLTSDVRYQPAWDEVEIAWDDLNKPLHQVTKNLKKVEEGVADLAEHFEIEDSDLLVQLIASSYKGVDETRTNIDNIVSNPDEGYIYWVELMRDRISLHAAPLHVGPLVEEYIFHEKETVVLTSATMRTAPLMGDEEPNFEYMKARLHAQETDELAVGSPFDYPANSLLYLVSDMPEPNQPGYQRYVEQAILDTAVTLEGRTMALFTSYRQLKQTADALKGPLAKEGITLLAQTQGGSRQQLTELFRDAGTKTVLLGTRSFWEGVDVPGMELSAVVLVKIPFDVPSDPVFAARSETFENSFFQYSVPEAILRWRQGFGRLIRRKDDEGVVLVLDKRVISKRYGQAFIDSLPESTTIRQPAGRISELLVRWFNRAR
ncbi:MAG: helicase C-terminal domain-containing protein [Ardenticatenaceae bacterium]|nr:helicase C-terminal domain-containing protein [Ardenticatenaceae bacterium]